MWAIEAFCDAGANIDTKDSVGRNPFLYAAVEGYDDICMYLSLRTKDINVESLKTGKTALI